jgi:hypothetical protein
VVVILRSGLGFSSYRVGFRVQGSGPKAQGFGFWGFSLGSLSMSYRGSKRVSSERVWSSSSSLRPDWSGAVPRLVFGRLGRSGAVPRLVFGRLGRSGRPPRLVSKDQSGAVCGCPGSSPKTSLGRSRRPPRLVGGNAGVTGFPDHAVCGWRPLHMMVFAVV